MAKPIETHSSCPDCGHKGCLSVFSDHTYCNSCSKWTKTLLENSDLDAGENYHYEYISRRGISASTHEFFGVKAKVNSETGEAISVSYPIRDASKIRQIAEKRFHTMGPIAKAGCFGADRFAAGSAKAITITEGDDDAMSVFEMMGKYPVISIQSASSAIRDVRENYDLINSFDKIYICTDNDEPGKKAAQDIASVFGFKKVYHVKCAPYKDANDFLSAGKTAEFRNVWFNAERFLPDGIVSSFNQIEAILNNASKRERWATPFAKLNFMLGGGFEPHRAYLISGLTGIGKTEFFRACQHKFFKDRPDENIGILHFEEPVSETVERAVGYELKTPVHLEESHVTKAQVLEEWKKLALREDRVHHVQHFGSENPDVILAKIRFLVVACGCSQIYFDNITVLGTGRIKEDSTAELDYLSTQLEMLVKELPFTLIFISHENEHEGTRGSANINKVVDVWLNLKRDVKNENEHARSIIYFMLNKNRQASRTGPAGRAIYDLGTATLSELTEDLPT